MKSQRECRMARKCQMDMLGAALGSGWSPQVADEERCVCGSSCFETSSFMPFMLEWCERGVLFLVILGEQCQSGHPYNRKHLDHDRLIRLGKLVVLQFLRFCAVEPIRKSANVGIPETLAERLEAFNLNICGHILEFTSTIATPVVRDKKLREAS